ncbi:MAG: T9SS type A sorting domain-containing protein, partial [Ignavibacteriaceae bacterium]|nr:T9SS type A sorting domain-containing protein [Ignavibacteriaceae bacterium]
SYFDNPSKEQSGNAVYSGREGTVNKESANIYYTVGDVLVDGSIINFKNITETTEINSNEDVKRYLETELFELNDNSSFLYSVQYGLTENTGNLFSNDEYVNFKVQLVDASTNEVIAVFDDVNYSANNILPYNSLQYSVNTNGIGSRTVKLMLDIEDNFDAIYSVTSKFADCEILPKAVRQEVGLGENINVTEYDLSQNYPNPFNPTTTIRYAIPQDGVVALKIYDILGKEVKTLVNDFKTKGRYEVTFDASRLASGLYIYEIKSGDYKAAKKMTLIK